MVEIATPEIPSAPSWSALERLNKERDLVGIYLSAHPLDDYAVVLQNVCNMQAVDMADLTPFANRDLLLGGIVTAVRKGVSKAGKPYGIVTIEDYSGSCELPLFGQDWPAWSGYMEVGSALLVTARCQPRQWDSNRLEFKIGKIDYLDDVKDKLIESFTIILPLDALTSDTLISLSEMIQQSPGPTSLFFQVVDAEEKMLLTLQSRTAKITVKKDLISYLESKPELSFKIN